MSEKLEFDADAKAEMATDAQSVDFDPQSPEIARLRRKVDYRMMPMLSLLYLFSFLDRVNIGNANVAGLSNDLGLTNSQYQFSLTIFFIGYILFGKVFLAWYPLFFF